MNLELNNTIKEIVDSMLGLYKKQLVDNNINASNTLHDSATTSITIDELSLTVYFNLEDYWKYVEYGRRAGKRPPISAIENWIEVKPIIPNPINGRIPTTKQLAFLIARKIGNEGTPAQKPLEKSVGYGTNTPPTDMSMLINQLKHEIISQLKKSLGEHIKDTI